jgi:hypothetical protein
MSRPQAVSAMKHSLLDLGIHQATPTDRPIDRHSAAEAEESTFKEGQVTV